MKIPGSWYGGGKDFQVRKITRRGGNLQLLMPLRMEYANGTKRTLKVLIDTGAEANIIKRGLAPGEAVYEAEEPLCFLAANEGRILGGTRASTPPSNFYKRWMVNFCQIP